MAHRVDPMDAPPPPPRARVVQVALPANPPQRRSAPAVKPVAVARPARAPKAQPWVLVGATAGFASTLLGFLATSLVG